MVDSDGGEDDGLRGDEDRCPFCDVAIVPWRPCEHAVALFGEEGRAAVTDVGTLELPKDLLEDIQSFIELDERDPPPSVLGAWAAFCESAGLTALVHGAADVEGVGVLELEWSDLQDDSGVIRELLEHAGPLQHGSWDSGSWSGGTVSVYLTKDYAQFRARFRTAVAELFGVITQLHRWFGDRSTPA